ncbi:hypothetical protein CFAM422_008767 [Trichoderma lentiforme]|uniref:Chromo domain-containing protein n=1 Tax=Trichoderma lentiforme TaxID=1567552 RepID=A0A9P5CC82_9HYPO|nr:hypothetical protein CFAM422_008767 [Trichoderma lentiforme]
MLLSTLRIGGVIALVSSLVHGSEILGPSSNCTTLDFSLLDSAPYPPHDIDIAQDHAFESYNLLGNDSWIITDRNGAHPPQWVHMSRANTIWGEDYESKRKIRRASGPDQLQLGWGFSQSNRCPYPSSEGQTHHCLSVFRLEKSLQWKNYDDADNTWEIIKNLKGAKDLAAEFHRSLNLKRSTKKDQTRNPAYRQRKKAEPRNQSDQAALFQPDERPPLPHAQPIQLFQIGDTPRNGTTYTLVP